MSKENIAIAKANNLFDGNKIKLYFLTERTDTVQEVSDKFLKLGSVFVPQPVLYGQESQTEYLDSYSKSDGHDLARNSNIDESYRRDHLNYLLTNFPQYISFNEGAYSCVNMPDELFQKEVLDRDLYCRAFNFEAAACINGVVWDSKELYDINERNTKQQLHRNIEVAIPQEEDSSQDSSGTTSIDNNIGRVGRTR